MFLKYSQNKQVIQSKIGDEVVMMDIETGFYFGLNSVASVVWAKLVTPTSFDELINVLMEVYNVDRQICEDDTRELLNQMVERKIISIVS